jgi:hypothetical protein
VFWLERDCGPNSGADVEDLTPLSMVQQAVLERDLGQIRCQTLALGWTSIIDQKPYGCGRSCGCS